MNPLEQVVRDVEAALAKLDQHNGRGHLDLVCTPDNLRNLLDGLAELKKDLVFVERWANHHGAKPYMTAQGALSCIQHYPPIHAITKSYVDGKVPETRNPWAELAAAQAEINAGNGVIAEYRVQCLANAREIQALKERERVLREDLLPLQIFMDSVFGEFPEHGDIDGFDLQDIAESCGLLEKVSTVTPCGEHCGCAEAGIADGTSTECWRVQPVMSRARIASAQHARSLTTPKGQHDQD